MYGDDYVGREEERLDVACPLDFISVDHFDEAALCVTFKLHAIRQNLEGLRRNLFLVCCLGWC